MKHILRNILQDVDHIQCVGNFDREFSLLTFDSRNADANSIFVAIKGSTSNGHDFIQDVIENACKIIFCEADFTFEENSELTFVIVKDSHLALAQLSSAFYGHPSKLLNLVGVTGTNGKTTVSTLLHQLFSNLGYHVGLLSTVENKIGQETIPSTHTTPNPIALNQLLKEMVDDGCSHCFMEVSSHAIHQKRIASLAFKGGIFTNITHDHLDYHKTFAEYRDVKKAFFDQLPKSAFALSNFDDKNGAFMLQNTNATKNSYALHNVADYKVKVLENEFSGLLLQFEETELWSQLIGDFNASNLLAVFASAQLLGEDRTEVLTEISKLKSVDGRFEYVKSKKGIVSIIDYAHTPDALENVLKTIKNIRTKNEKVITVIGCGGDRDKTKRPVMAEIACEYSDHVIMTSDNPRSENPETILEEMSAGVPGQHFKKTLSITDRSQAIKTAVSMAEAKDIILIAGKGHEKYQEINGVKHDFDDMQKVVEMFNKMEK